MKSLGQIAYEAYATKVDWKSPFTGQILKEWDTLKIMNPIVAEAWECAASRESFIPCCKWKPCTVPAGDSRGSALIRKLPWSEYK